MWTITEMCIRDSHPDEWIDYEAMAAGSRVLYQMIRKLDEED